MHFTKRPEECVITHDSSKVYEGYTLFAPHASTDVWLINMKGQIVHHWKMSTPLGGPARLLPNGNQIRINKTFKEPTASMGTVGGELVEVDWEGNIIWKYEDLYLHHDFKRLENGNTLLNRHVKIPPGTAKKVKGGIPGSDSKEGMWGNAFQEITPLGEVVWEWLGYEYMDPDIDIPCALEPRTIWGYVNGMDTFPNGDIVASFRHLNRLLIIDRRTKIVKWRWGDWELGHQHNPTVLENGNILVFDNGFHRLSRGSHNCESYSRVLEVNSKTGRIEWEYTDPTKFRFFSALCSSAKRLPNGNTLICESLKGRIFEVTPDKEIVWDFINPFYEFHDVLGWTNHIFHAYRYGYDFLGFNGRALDNSHFEYTVQEKGKYRQAVSPKKRAADRRLKLLGY
tara:strand:- start:5082 stop:6272 length:1191 start_codon:yes stop_codon:yes gene_type:complete